MKQLQTPDFSDPKPAYSSLTDKQLLNRYTWFKRMCKPSFMPIGEKLAKLTTVLPQWSYRWFAKKTIFKFFIGGENLNECENRIDTLHTSGVGAILDLSVEAAKSDKSVNKAISIIEETINLAKRNNKKVPFTVFKVTGLMNKEVLMLLNEKLKNNEQLTLNEKKKYNTLRKRINKLCSQAFHNDVRIMIDAEETWLQFLIDHFALKMMANYNKEKVTVLNTYQMYLKSGMTNLNLHIETARKNGFQLGVKIVRGAYMEKEREKARLKHYPTPINDTKDDTDTMYNLGLRTCVKNISIIEFVAGTHNKESIKYLMQLMDEYSISRNTNRIYFSQLFGMGDILSFNLSAAGYSVCKYLPFGPVKEVIPYLVRRARENSSLNGFASQELQSIASEIVRRNLVLS